MMCSSSPFNLVYLGITLYLVICDSGEVSDAIPSWHFGLIFKMGIDGGWR
jgi:hypothetical protein